tara:strand:+ start:327 stop:779 length:453 start_codon:yes stop_codon:yes gene_type:complete
MKDFFRRVSPKRAVNDFVELWQQPTEHRWPTLGVAAAATFAIFMLFIPDSQRIEPRPPEVTYITSWAADRTDEEIIESNIANQERKDELAAIEQERAELRKDMYRALGRATFIDVDEMEAEIEAERAAEAAASTTDQSGTQENQAAPGGE